MFIEKWKDTAFGTDNGSDFRDLLEEIPNHPLTLSDVYQHCDLKKYINNTELLNERTDNNIKINNPDFDQFVHYEDAIIALSAIVIESELNGEADLSEAYGNETITFQVTKQELATLETALSYIHDNPDKFVLFELCSEEEKKETLANISEMLEQLQVCINKK